MSYDLYPENSITSSGSPDVYMYSGASSSGKEIDLRTEFARILHGSGREIPKGQRGLLRRARRDDDGLPIPCSCVDALTHEPDKDSFCPYCQGSGFLWDEEWITYYKVLVSSNEGLVRKDRIRKAGVVNVPYAFFYVEYFVNPTRYDKVVEVERSSDGKVVIPYTRTDIFEIATAQAFRSDSGRIEYWRLGVVDQAIKPQWQK